jgi:fructosamine-3-kinase
MQSARLESMLRQEFGSGFSILNINSVGGGSINQCYRLHTSQGNFFLKTNNAPFASDMFKKEAKGLQTLIQAHAFLVPEAILQGKTDDFDFLLLEHIERGIATADSWQLAGKQLAQLHQIHASQHGLDYDNYIGSLPQSNRQHQKFYDFFINERLEPQVRMAEKKGLLNCTATDYFESLYVKLPTLLPDEQPALLHGDLWSGNMFFDTTGNPVIFDPAVYYGNRESDIAFTKLFGGFNDNFYKSYHYHFPMQNGFRERIDLYNLYPLLVHLNLFGTGYLHDVMNIVKRYCNV